MIKIFKCPIVESNSGPLDAKSDALPVETNKQTNKQDKNNIVTGYKDFVSNQLDWCIM